MYTVWDADHDHQLSAHPTTADAIAAMNRIRRDIARDVAATGEGSTEITMAMDVRDDDGETVVFDWGGVEDLADDCDQDPSA